MVRDDPPRSGQSRETSPRPKLQLQPPAIALTDLDPTSHSHEAVVSAAGSLSPPTTPSSTTASNTPPSSLRPSSSSRDRVRRSSSASRSDAGTAGGRTTRSSSSSSRATAAEQSVPGHGASLSAEAESQQLPPIPQGAVPEHGAVTNRSSTRSNSPAQNATPSSAPANAGSLADGETPSRSSPGSILSINSWLQLRKNISKRNWAQNSIGLAAFVCAVITTAFYTYRAYKLAKWTALSDYFQECWNEEVRPEKSCFAYPEGDSDEPGELGPLYWSCGSCMLNLFLLLNIIADLVSRLQQAGRLSPKCQNVLTKHLPDPPYVDWGHLIRRAKRWIQTSGEDDVDPRTPTSPETIRVPWWVPVGLSISVILFAYLKFYLTTLHRRRHPAYWRRAPRPTSDYPAWDSVPVRLEGPISTSVDTGGGSGTRRRRIIPSRDNKTFVDYRSTKSGGVGGSSFEEPRKRSFQDRWNELWSNPSWRRNSAIKYFMDDAEDTTKEQADHEEKDGKGTMPIQPWHVTPHAHDSDAGSESQSLLSKYKHRVHRKLGFHRSSASDDDQDVDAPLTALGADPHSDENDSDSDLASLVRHRRVRIREGAVSIGLVHSGAAAAVVGAGEAGHELFVQEVGANEDVGMPIAPQDVSLGLNSGNGASVAA